TNLRSVGLPRFGDASKSPGGFPGFNAPLRVLRLFPGSDFVSNHAFSRKRDGSFLAFFCGRLATPDDERLSQTGEKRQGAPVAGPAACALLATAFCLLSQAIFPFSVHSKSAVHKEESCTYVNNAVVWPIGAHPGSLQAQLGFAVAPKARRLP